MILLQIIGLVGAILFVAFYPKRKTHQRVLVRTKDGFVDEETAMQSARGGYQQEKDAWLIAHSDPLFGRPLDHDGIRYFEYSRANPNKDRTPNEYNVPFSIASSGFVHVSTDEFPLHDQKFIFEWMVESMDDVAAAITGHLTSLPRSWGVTDEEAATAFRPERITWIRLEGSGPVAWTIVFDTDIGEGEALVGIVRGEDQKVIKADLDYG